MDRYGVELKKRLRLLEVIHEMTVALSRADALEDIYEAALDGLQAALGVERASILTFDRSGVMRFRAWRELSDSYRATTDGHSPWTRDEPDPKPILVEDITQAPELESLCQVILDEGIRALAFMPLVSNNRLLGKFMLYYGAPHRFTEEEVQAAEDIASHIAFAIERQEAQANEKEHQTVVEALYQIGASLVSELDMQKLVQRVTDLATQVTNAAFGAFFYNVTDETGESYLLYTLSGAPLEAFGDFPHPRNTSIFAPTFRGEGVIRLDDVTEDPRYGQNPPYFGIPEGHLPVRSYLAVPVVSRSGEVVGGLFFGHPQPGRFSEVHERLAVGIASWAAVGIDNARLYKQTQETMESLEQRVQERTFELRQMNERLAHNEARFRSLIENTSDVITILEADGTIRYESPSLERMLGYKPVELIGKSAFDFIHPDDTASVIAVFREAIKTPGAIRQVEFRFRHKDGSWRYLEAVGKNLLDDLAVTAVVVHSRDVTWRKQAEEVLKKREAQLAEAQQIARLGSWEWDVVNDTITWSDQLYRSYGLEPEGFEASYEAYLQYVHPEDREQVHEIVSNALQTGQPFSFYHRLIRPDRAVRTMHSQGRVEVNEAGEVIRMLGTGLDVTELKETEQALRQSQALYQSIAENIPNGSVVVIDKERRYRLAAGPLIDQVGMVGELEGKYIWEVMSPELVERRIPHYEAAFAGKSSSEEVAMGERVLLLQTVPLYDKDGEVEAALVLSQDITDRKEAEVTTRALLRLSEKLNSTLDLDTLVETLIQEAIRLTGAESGMAGLYTSQGFLTRTYYHQGQVIPIDELWPVGRGVPGWLIEHKQPYITNDAENDPYTVPDFVARFGLRSVLSTPVLDRHGKVLGFFEVNNKQAKGGFTEKDVEKLVGLAQIAAVAIQNAQLFERLRELSRKVVSAQEEERRRLSRELHDSAGQLLTALSINLSLLVEQVVADEELRAHASEALELLNAAHEEIRATSHALRPPAMEMVGLDGTLRALANDFGRQARLPIHYQGADVPSLPDQVGISFYRFLQETLTNAARHAHASRVEVKLCYDEEGVSLTVQDDGIGMSGADQHLSSGILSGVGLLGLKERFELIGGEMRVVSRPGEGTQLVARWRPDGQRMIGADQVLVRAEAIGGQR